MKSFPKFLNVKPTFYGLNFMDIVISSLVLYVGVFFELNPIFTLISTGLFMVLKKYIKANFDIVGFSNRSSEKTLSWNANYKDIV